MGKVSKVSRVSGASGPVLDGPKSGRDRSPSLWPEDMGIDIDVCTENAAIGSVTVGEILQRAVDAIVQEAEAHGLQLSLSSRNRTADGRNTACSLSFARSETIELVMERRGPPMEGSGVPQDEPVEG